MTSRTWYFIGLVGLGICSLAGTVSLLSGYLLRAVFFGICAYANYVVMKTHQDYQ